MRRDAEVEIQGVPNGGDRSRLRASRQRNSPNGGIWDGQSTRGSRRAGGKVVRKKKIAEGHTCAFRREGRSLRAASPGRLRWRGSPPVTSVRGGAGSTGRSTTRQRLTPNSARSGDASERLRMRGPYPRVASLPRSATWSGHRGTQRLEARLQMGGVGRMAGNGEVRTGYAGGKVAGRPGSPGGETPISAFYPRIEKE